MRLNGSGPCAALGAPRWKQRLVFAAMVSTALTGFLLAQSAQAQSVPAAPVRSAVDGNGVDLFSGALNVDAPSMSLGDASNGVMTLRPPAKR